MNKTIQIGFTFLLTIFICSCAGTRKVDFDTAYKFSTYRYQEAIEESADRQQEAQHLTTSLSDELSNIQPNSLRSFEESLAERIGFDPHASGDIKKAQIRAEVRSMSARERRQLKKEIRAELKKLSHEAEMQLDTAQDEQVSQMSDATRLSIIAGSVGLILLILGAIFSVSFLTIVGAIITVGAAILFIVDQV